MMLVILSIRKISLFERFSFRVAFWTMDWLYLIITYLILHDNRCTNICMLHQLFHTFDTSFLYCQMQWSLLKLTNNRVRYHTCIITSTCTSMGNGISFTLLNITSCNVCMTYHVIYSTLLLIHFMTFHILSCMHLH